MKVELDLSNHATKADLKNASLKSNVDKSDIDKLKNALSTFSNLKSKVDKLDVDKLVTVPLDLSKLNDVVKNVEDKIPNVTNFATTTALNAKIN